MSTQHREPPLTEAQKAMLDEAAGWLSPSTALLGCPSCGCEGHHQEGPPGFWKIHCRDCGMGTAPMPTQESATKVWNRRQPNRVIEPTSQEGIKPTSSNAAGEPALPAPSGIWSTC